MKFSLFDPARCRFRCQLWAGVVLGLAGAAAAAAPPGGLQTLKDAALEALYVAGKSDELQHAALQRLATQPDDAQAVLALGLAALDKAEAPARVQALARAQACVDKQPREAACQYALGVLLGLQAMSEGMIQAARSAGTVKAALTAAHEIDPSWYAARSSLVEFHLLAPGLLGGSSSQAAVLARAAPQPAQVSALQARVLMQESRFEAALAAFQALPQADPSALGADVRGWGTQAALALVNGGGAAKARPFFDRLMRERPGDAAAPYGLARVAGEAGDWAEALRLLQLAGGLNGARDWPLGWRIGIAQQQLGRPDEAKASLARFVAAGKGQKPALDDARKRLAQLSGG